LLLLLLALATVLFTLASELELEVEVEKGVVLANDLDGSVYELRHVGTPKTKIDTCDVCLTWLTFTIADVPEQFSYGNLLESLSGVCARPEMTNFTYWNVAPLEYVPRRPPSTAFRCPPPAKGKKGSKSSSSSGGSKKKGGFIVVEKEEVVFIRGSRWWWW